MMDSSYSSQQQQQQQQQQERKVVAQLSGHDGPVQAVTFSADGKYVLTGGGDRSMRLWNPLRRDPYQKKKKKKKKENTTSLYPQSSLPIHHYTDGLTHPIKAVACASQTAVAACERTLVCTDLVTGKWTRRLTTMHTINHVDISTDNESIFVSASFAVSLWDGKNPSSYKPIQVLKEAKDAVTWVSIDKHLIRTTSVDGYLRTYDVRMGQLLQDGIGHPLTSACAMTDDDDTMVVNCFDGQLRMVDCASGQVVNTCHGGHVAGNYTLPTQVTADGASVLTGSEDGTVCCYDAVRGTVSQSMSMGNTKKPVCALACHPQDSAVVVAAAYEGPALVWGTSDTVIAD